MVERLIITGIIGLISIAGFEIFSGFGREKATQLNVIKGSNKKPQIMYFRSESCSSCAAQNQYMSELNQEIQQAILKIDVDEQPLLAESYGVMSLPTTLLNDAKGNTRFINYGIVNAKKLTSQWESVLS